eukprot:4589639-Karenia_brevis.AAC.1
MHRLTNAMKSRKTSLEAWGVANDILASRINDHEQLLFVYDFCTCTCSFDTLKYVRDARRPPLQTEMNDERFAQIYGLSAEVTFTRYKPRERITTNWWQGIY